MPSRITARILFFVFVCISLFANGQISPSRIVRIQNINTEFGSNLPNGTIILDISTAKMYQTLKPVESTKSISSLVVGTDYREFISDIAYDETSWNNNLDAATKNAVRDELELKENISNKSTEVTLGTSDDLFPTQNAVKSYVDGKTSVLFPGMIQDADHDTKLQVEKSTDNDKIHFDLAGTEKWVMDGSRLESKNSGLSVFIGEGAGLNDDQSNNSSVFVGYQAGYSNTSGENNTASGGSALYSNTTGVNNTATGYRSMYSNDQGYNNTAYGSVSMHFNTSGRNNTANGYLTLNANTSGIFNSGFGSQSLVSNNIGNYNSASGAQALLTNTSGNNNTALGYQSLYSNSTGNNNVAIGYQAGYNETGSNKLYIENSNSATPLIYGEFDNNLLRVNGNMDVTGLLSIRGGSPGAGKILTSDADGDASWQTAATNGTVTNVTSATIDQLTVASETSTPVISIVTADVADDGTALATGNQIYDFVTGQAYLTSETQNLSSVLSKGTDANSKITNLTTPDNAQDAATKKYVDDNVAASTVFETTSNVTSNSPGTLAADDFLFGSSSLDDDTDEDHDNRLFFDKSKGAFRAGATTTSNWDDSYRGVYSIALGLDSRASEKSTVALGEGALATAVNAVAIGHGAWANESDANAFGALTKANGQYSTSLGVATIANGEAATASGSWTTATGDYSATFNNSTVANGESSAAFGRTTKADASNSFAIGYYNSGGLAASYPSQNSDPLFQIGNGQNLASPSNALTVFKNGNAELQGTLKIGAYTLPQADGSTGQVLATNGSGTMAWISPTNGAFKTTSNITSNAPGTIATDDFVFGATALYGVTNDDDNKRMFFDKSKGAFRAGYDYYGGWTENEIGEYSVAFGSDTKASGSVSSAFGYHTTASGEDSFAACRLTTASGISAAAFGSVTLASGDFSASFGQGTKAEADYSFAIGGFNTGGDASDYPTQNSVPLFQIGNGNSSDDIDRSNAFTVFRNGNAELQGTLKIGAYTLPQADGSTGQVLATNGSGTMAWTTPAASYLWTRNTTTATLSPSASADHLKLVGRMAINGATINVNSALNLIVNNGGYGIHTTGTQTSGETYAMYNELTDNDTGSSMFGIRNHFMNDPGTSFNSFYTSGNVSNGSGVLTELSVTGTANGVHNNLSGAGSMIGVKNTITTTGSAQNSYGMYTDITSITANNVYGAYFNVHGTGTNYGIYVANDGGDSYFGDQVQLKKQLLDADGDAGSSYQVLSSTGTATNWISMGFSTSANVTSNSPGNLTSDDFVFGSSSLADLNFTTNDDSRMFFDKSKGAFRAGKAIDTRWDDSSVGSSSFACGYNTTASGSYSFAQGNNALASGQSAIAMGLDATASGNWATAIGRSASATAESATAIGLNATASNTFSTAIGYRVTASGESSTAMGNYVSTNGYQGSFIIGDMSSTTTLNCTTNSQMVARFYHGYTFYTNETATIGATIGHGQSSWSSISDSTKKENYAKVDGEYFLQSLSKLKLGSWNYKGTNPKDQRHYGPMAQEIFKYFGKDELGTIGCDTLLATADMDGIIMICLQALEKRSENLQYKNEKLSIENEKLKENYESLRMQLAKMEKMIEILLDPSSM